MRSPIKIGWSGRPRSMPSPSEIIPLWRKTCFLCSMTKKKRCATARLLATCGSNPSNLCGRSVNSGTHRSSESLRRFPFGHRGVDLRHPDGFRYAEELEDLDLNPGQVK